LADLTYANNEDPQNALYWGRYLFYAIVSQIWDVKFTYYGGDTVEGVRKWFAHEEIKDHVTLRRLNSENLPDGPRATTVREAIIAGDYQFVADHCPPSVYKRVCKLQEICLQVFANPQEDFSIF
jgi:hypothetical protein